MCSPLNFSTKQTISLESNKYLKPKEKDVVLRDPSESSIHRRVRSMPNSKKMASVLKPNQAIPMYFVWEAVATMGPGPGFPTTILYILMVVKATDRPTLCAVASISIVSPI